MTMDRGILLQPIGIREQEAAETLGVSTSALRAWRSQGRGPAFSRLGRRVIYPVSALEEYVRKNLVESGDLR